MHAIGNLFVVAIDFWPPSLNALVMAVRLARQFKGRILAVHVLERGAHYPEGLDIDIDTQQEDLQNALEQLVQPFRINGMSA